MKNYVIRLSASGVLVLSAVGCGSDETSKALQSTTDTSTFESKTEQIEQIDCAKAPKNIDLEQYLDQLQKQGRLTECDVEVQLINQQQISFPPESEI